MGNEPPAIPPVIEDDKYYVAYVTVFDSHPDTNPGCDNPVLKEVCCSMIGSELKAKIKRGDECKDFQGICFPDVVHQAQRLKSVVGPFDSAWDAYLATGCGN